MPLKGRQGVQWLAQVRRSGAGGQLRTYKNSQGTLPEHCLRRGCGEQDGTGFQV